ncbi:MAG: hypothetical protein LLG14_16830 [Nocardiaceae bacterium]|nr:hypothetical protein [Nocardiaceae bacterium]
MGSIGIVPQLIEFAADVVEYVGQSAHEVRVVSGFDVDGLLPVGSKGFGYVAPHTLNSDPVANDPESRGASKPRPVKNEAGTNSHTSGNES